MSKRLQRTSKRLQVLLDEAELREIRRIARTQRMTVAEWVRQALRAASRREPLGDIGRKIESIRGASRHAFPTGDIDQILSDIERGYLDQPTR
jgi:predicted 2-oxoglutarate/Fe(II)-dependent dioxygenase YbiX